ncbi:bacillithiol system redox-active protein YtxJ [Niabella drilacis]|uniref:Bacillithiol system protein YtxJ n=1 Tax=Niabella drilacis (strain DSM 25811 / CCM 8410 / CCUG 62505 / LMG 26954 / E90) TaxID=1285928 RepID=A0A1G6M1P2_NIADE|nr:bacillithiol system redox-active protein YtxJ [Niabella drilacis]SDC48866.1 bacillithiol system protein YtxJ [Niabella drilacis]
MNWIPLEQETQLDAIDLSSGSRPQLIFKHSTRCSISSVVKSRLNKGRLPDMVDFYYLDLIAYRDLSNAIAERYGIRHESPQVLLIKDRKCVYHESHSSVYMEDILDAAG